MIDPSKVLATLPAGLRDPLIEKYGEIARNYAERRWEPSELNGGKFCEVAFTIIDGCIRGSFAAKPSKPHDMVAACRALEGIPPNVNRVGDRSLRILIPRMLAPLYEIRNNRNVGHVGGDVDPNQQDATTVYGMASWIMAELVRIFHGVPLKEAQEIVAALVERKHPLIWEVEGKKRVLNHTMEKGDQALLLLYSEPSWVDEKILVDWVEYSNLTVFRRAVLEPFHKSRMVEYDARLRRVRISPRGAREVEDRILPNNGDGKH
jgi:hypothetical protein